MRAGLTTLAHHEKLSDELIVPNLDQDTWFFYDPATKKLRARFAHYPQMVEDVAQFFRESLSARSVNSSSNYKRNALAISPETKCDRKSECRSLADLERPSRPQLATKRAGRDFSRPTLMSS